MSTLEKLASRAVAPRFVRLGELVFRIERVNSDALRREGFATLEGSAAVQDAVDRAQRLAAAEYDAASGVPAETIQERQAHADRLASERNAIVMEAMNRDAPSQLAFLARCDSYIRAAVSGLGGAVNPDPDRHSEVYPAGTPVDSVTRDLQPCKIVTQRSEMDVDAGTLWLHVLSESERRILGMVIAHVLQEEASLAVMPFRPGARGTGST